MSMKRMVLALFGVASIASLTGCSSLVGGNSEYGCKGMPDSVTCMSVGEVYELTDGDNYKQRVSEVSQQQMAGKEVNVKHQTAGGEVSGPSVSGALPTSLFLNRLRTHNRYAHRHRSCGYLLTHMSLLTVI